MSGRMNALDQLIAQIESTRKQLAALEEVRERLEAAAEDALRVAKGTGDLVGHSLLLKNGELRDEIERLITEEPRSLSDLCEILAPNRDEEEYLRIRAALQWVKRNRHVVNLGTAKSGVWSIPSSGRKRRTKKD